MVLYGLYGVTVFNPFSPRRAGSRPLKHTRLLRPPRLPHVRLLAPPDVGHQLLARCVLEALLAPRVRLEVDEERAELALAPVVEERAVRGGADGRLALQRVAAEGARRPPRASALLARRERLAVDAALVAD